MIITFLIIAYYRWTNRNTHLDSYRPTRSK